jgi:hypothetical protein
MSINLPSRALSAGRWAGPGLAPPRCPSARASPTPATGDFWAAQGHLFRRLFAFDKPPACSAGSRTPDRDGQGRKHRRNRRTIAAAPAGDGRAIRAERSGWNRPIIRRAGPSPGRSQGTKPTPRPSPTPLTPVLPRCGSPKWGESLVSPIHSAREGQAAPAFPPFTRSRPCQAFDTSEIFGRSEASAAPKARV